MGLADRLRKLGMRKLPEQRRWLRRPEVLLCPQIPKPLHEVAPRVVLGSRWWDETREAAYKSTDRHCIACGVEGSSARGRAWLEGHEIYDVDYLLGRSTYIETVPLCHYCHSYIHRGRLEAMLERGQVSQATYAAIIQHGDRVIREAGLLGRMPYTGPVAEWADWRLVVNGQEYPPKYKTIEEWSHAHGAV